MFPSPPLGPETADLVGMAKTGKRGGNVTMSKNKQNRKGKVGRANIRAECVQD